MSNREDELRHFLDSKYKEYNQPGFIANDPITIPHEYSKNQDIEIAGFVASMLAWGQRVTIINKCREFFSYMDNDPYNFILNHSDQDLKPFENFKHRTFNGTDALYFIAFFKMHYSQFSTLEDAFLIKNGNGWDAKDGLISFANLFFSIPDHPTRTYKHIPNPIRKSACKRMNMYLRWMVRKDNCGVDFGLWDRIKPKDLICPCDLHVDRVARKLGLITRKQTDWNTAIELTEHLKKFDKNDPVKYDFELFGLGVEEKF